MSRLSSTQIELLKVLVERGGPDGVFFFGIPHNLRSPAVLDRLARGGLIEQLPHPDYWRATAAGRTAYTEAGA